MHADYHFFASWLIRNSNCPDLLYVGPNTVWLIHISESLWLCNYLVQHSGKYWAVYHIDNAVVNNAIGVLFASRLFVGSIESPGLFGFLGGLFFRG
ncbi:MAG: hypothetical protein WAW10_12590 [Gallionella sp.]